MIKFKDLLKESLNEASEEKLYFEMKRLTSIRQDAIQDFVEKNNLDLNKLHQYIVKGKLSERMDLATAISGKPDNKYAKDFIQKFSK